MKYFSGISTLDELKKVYRTLAFANHPDRGGNIQTMQEINNEYDVIFAELKAGYNAKEENKDKQTTEAPAEFRDIISKIINLDGIEIELCGSWLWISGNTYKHKDAIKEAGFAWSKTKKMWYWHHEEDGHIFYRGKKSIDSIRKTYGSEILKVSRMESIGA